MKQLSNQNKPINLCPYCERHLYYCTVLKKWRIISEPDNDPINKYYKTQTLEIEIQIIKDEIEKNKREYDLLNRKTSIDIKCGNPMCYKNVFYYNTAMEKGKLLLTRLARLETIEKQNKKYEIEKREKREKEAQNIKDEIEKIKKEKEQINIDANKTFGIPIKKLNEEYGIVTQNIISPHQNILIVNGNQINYANRTSLDSQLRCYKHTDFDYVTKGHGEVYFPRGYIVLWVPSTGNITYVFTKEQINLPIKLNEIYNY
jgi:hypothetical protein